MYGLEFMVACQATEHLIDLRHTFAILQRPIGWPCLAVWRQQVGCHEFDYSSLISVQTLECFVIPQGPRGRCWWMAPI